MNSYIDIRTAAQRGDETLFLLRLPLDRMCAAAIDCLLKQVNGEPYSMDLLFPVDISRRASTRGYLLSAEN